MIITIDRGNTNCKVALFEENKLQKVITFEEFMNDVKLMNSKGAFSCVGEPIEFPSQLIRPLNYREEKSFLEMPIHYSNTLGEDRMICAYHVFKTEHPSRTAFKRSLVIDAGTYLTVDCVSKIGFEGGFIFPGLQVYLNSYEWGAALPRLEENQIKEGQIELPQDTDSAITESAKVYLEAVFEKLIKLYSPAKIYLTGGNAQKVRPFLGSKNEVVYDKNLIHQALYTFYRELNPNT